MENSRNFDFDNYMRFRKKRKQELAFQKNRAEYKKRIEEESKNVHM